MQPQELTTFDSMNGRPLVSILLPVYNAELFLSACMNSIMKQSWQELEIIVIDDGSTDASAAIIEQLRDSRIKFSKHSVNLGLISTLNEGLKLAKGRYVARMDADDIAHPERIAKQVAFMEANKHVGIAGSAMELIGTNSGVTHVETTSERIKSKLLFSTPFNHPTVIFRRELIDDGIIFYDRNFPHAEDFELWSRVKDVTEFGNIDAPLLQYRTHAAQVTAVHDNTLESSVRNVLNRLLKELGVTPTEAEINLHMTLFRHEFSSEKLDLEACQNWLIRLFNCNNESGIYSKADFQEACGRMWFLACTTQASKENQTLDLYKSSVLSEAYTAPLPNRIKFHIKQWRKR